ncbi:Transcriptional regulator, DeoR family [hydrothermal vent metagenome]|uniref:Transcriptional regulator, DeoR family n=1 Tax=hydrothermal vent metagenome TaxID=652676 RepID=A0A3B1D6P7_9ZZZZ
MRRADRLFKIVNFLRSRRRAVTAYRIAEEFEVCERTIYRDISDLMNSSVPIYGEAGVGYIIDEQYSVPPLIFDVEEIEALVLGASIVSSWTDKEFSKIANRALDKIKNVLPEPLKEEFEATALTSYPSQTKIPWTVSFSAIRKAIRKKLKLKIKYQREDGQKSQRIIRPLALVFFSPVWLLLGWCEQRNDFRNFRLDRISQLKNLQHQFEHEKGKSLQDYLKTL